jgi:dihydrofolate reductase
MRRVFSFLLTTLDGYYEGPNREFDFWTADDEFDEFSAAQLDEAGMLVFGRVTYEGMVAYWPTPAAAEDNPLLASRMNDTPKVVVSRTLDENAEWANTQVLRRPEDVAALKAQAGDDLAVLGSSSLTVALLQLGLVDELRILVNPVVIGAGRSLFRGAKQQIDLTLVNSRAFRSGNVLLTYQPASRPV